MAAIISVSPTVAQVGDTITITQLGVALGSTACNVEDGQSFIMYPNGVVADVEQYQGGFALNQGQTITCLPAPGGGIISGCLPVTLTYVVQPGDVNNPLLFTTPRGFTSGFVPGTPGQIKFLAVSDGFLVGSDENLTAGGQGNVAVTIRNPQIQVTKECVSECTPYGDPIEFEGTVSNVGDILLVDVNVSDDPPALITFADTTSLGNPFPPDGGGDLLPGESVNYTGVYTPSGDLCGPFTDTITATGTSSSQAADFQPREVEHSASATCYVVTNPSISLEKDCQPREIALVDGVGSYVETFTVTNTGDVPLENVRVHDTRLGVTTTYFCPPGVLLPGEFCVIEVGFDVTAEDCGPITDTAVAEADNICPEDENNPCPHASSVLSNEAECTVTVLCEPDICVVKEVACFVDAEGCDPSSEEGCGPFGPSATGVRVGDQCPVFCYRVSVTNCGQVPLTNVVLEDLDLPGVVINVGNLAVGETQDFYLGAFEICEDLENTVVATGVPVGIPDTTPVTDQDSALVEVLEASLECEKTVDSPSALAGSSSTHLILPDDGATHVVTWTVTVSNTGDTDLWVTIADPMLADCIEDTYGAHPAVVFIAAGDSVQFSCETDYLCDHDQPVVNTVTVTGEPVHPDGESEICGVAVHGEPGEEECTPIRATSECSAEIVCQRQNFGGCTPGFWKNCVSNWPVSLETTVEDVFGSLSCAPTLEGDLLHTALTYPGGPGVLGAARILLRAAAAAYLNARHDDINYPLTEAEIIAAVQAVLNVGDCDRQAILALATELDDMNNEFPCVDVDGNGIPCNPTKGRGKP